jgi:hypothetical protein
MKRLEYYVKLMSKNSISEYGFFPISDHGSGSWIRILDAGVRKALDPGSGSATLAN